MAPAWRRVFRWPWSLEAVWLLLPSVVLTLAMAVKPTPPHDYWWHLAFGRQIAVEGAVPKTSLFLYTIAADTPFHDLPWLGQWAMYRLYAALGHRGNALALSVLVLAAWLIVVDGALRRTDRAKIVAIVASIAALLVTPTLTARTQMFAFPLYASVLFVVFGVADGWLPRSRLWLLAPAVALWANVHGSFVLGPILMAAVGAASLLERYVRARPPSRGDLATWIGATLAAVLGGVVSPVGAGNYPYLVSIFGIEDVTEWQPPDFRSGEGAAIWTAIVLSSLVMLVRIRRARFHELAVFVLMTYLAASAVRSLFWWAALLPLVLAPQLAELVPARRAATASPLVNAICVALLAAVIIALQPGLLLERVRTRFVADARKRGEGAGLLTIDSPVSLVERVARSHADGRVFHDQRVGGLLELMLTAPGSPRQVAFVDQRMELVPDDVWQDYFRISRGQDWQRELDRWQVTTLLLHETSQRPLLEAVRSSAAWRAVATEDAFWLFERSAAR